jgi:uncharacterized protein YecE (DUF72 family)
MLFPLPRIFVGCAGWSIARAHAEEFPEPGTHLERYAQRLPAVEINSSFYRPHQPQTYARWAASTPQAFRFAVKLPRAITHTRRLRDSNDLLERFLAEAGNLGEKLGPILVQLPPSLRFEEAVAREFFADLRARFAGEVVCEPRHASWFTPEGDDVLVRAQIARVAADPPPVRAAAVPGGWSRLVYYRLHGSPVMYESDYEASYLKTLAQAVRTAAETATVWCIFDNTALGAATVNALDLLSLFGAAEVSLGRSSNSSVQGKPGNLAGR